MNIVYCYPNDHNFPETLGRKYQGQGWEIATFDPQTTVLERGYVILQDPVWRNGAFVSGWRVWKKYFQQRAPSTRLIIAGLDNVQHPNYADLLNLPQQLPDLLMQAQTCAHDWQLTGAGGIEAGRLLKRFFDGHGSDSIRESYSKVSRNVKVIADELALNTPLAEIAEGLIRPVDLPAQWRSFYLRWENYLPWFQALPFSHTLQKADAVIRHISPYFENGCENFDTFRSLNVKTHTDLLKELLDETGRYIS